MCIYMCSDVHHYCWAGFGLDEDPHTASMLRVSISASVLNDTRSWHYDGVVHIRGRTQHHIPVINLFVSPMIDRRTLPTRWMLCSCTIDTYIGCLLNVETLYYLPVHTNITSWPSMRVEVDKRIHMSCTIDVCDHLYLEYQLLTLSILLYPFHIYVRHSI